MWQCSTYLAGKNRRVSKKEDGLAKAKDFAEDGYLGLRGKARSGEISSEKTFREAAAQIEREYQIITEGQRNAQYVKGHSTPAPASPRAVLRQHGIIRDHAGPDPGVPHSPPPGNGEETRQAAGTEHHASGNCCSAADAQSRRAPSSAGPPARSLRTLPGVGQDLAPRVVSPEEYKQLYEATRRLARAPKNVRYKWESEQLHDYVLFQVKIVEDDASNETILEIEGRGKRGVGHPGRGKSEAGPRGTAPHGL